MEKASHPNEFKKFTPKTTPILCDPKFQPFCLLILRPLTSKKKKKKKGVKKRANIV